MRRFYLEFQIAHALRAQLSWTLFCLLMSVKNEAARNFYIVEASKNNWSTCELDRQISSLLFERLSLSSEKEVRAEDWPKGRPCLLIYEDWIKLYSKSGNLPQNGIIQEIFL